MCHLLPNSKCKNVNISTAVKDRCSVFCYETLYFFPHFSELKFDVAEEAQGLSFFFFSANGVTARGCARADLNKKTHEPTQRPTGTITCLHCRVWVIKKVHFSFIPFSLSHHCSVSDLTDKDSFKVAAIRENWTDCISAIALISLISKAIFFLKDANKLGLLTSMF